MVSLPAGTYKITRPGAEEDGNVTGDFDLTGLNSLTIEPADGNTKVVVNSTVSGNSADGNGGQTPTHALLEGSPAIGTGGTTGLDACPATDPAGRERPAGTCDIGAMQFFVVPAPVDSAQVKIKKVKPKVLKLKRGKKPKRATIVIRSVGDAAAQNVKLCLAVQEDQKGAQGQRKDLPGAGIADRYEEAEIQD